MIIYFIPIMYIIAAIFFYLRLSSSSSANKEMRKSIGIRNNEEWMIYNKYFSKSNLLAGLLLIVATSLSSNLIDLKQYIIILIILQTLPYIIIALRSHKVINSYRDKS